MAEPTACAQVRDLIPELAAGVAPGDARAEALAHLATCLGCRRELADTSAVIDELVLLAPSHEPPAGFETRVLAALELPAPRRRRATALWVAALVVAIALAGGLAAGATWWATADDRRIAGQYRETLAEADGRYLIAADVRTASGAEVGHVFGYEGRPSWVFVTLTASPAAGPYRLLLVTTDGQEIDTGATCGVESGAGSCGAAVSMPLRQIERIELRADGERLTAALH